MKNKDEFLGTILVLIAGIMWGMSGVFVRFFSSLGLSSLQITVFKIGLAAIILLLYCAFFNREALKIKIKDIWIFACTGLISLDFFTICYFFTIQKTSLSVAAVLLYLSPIFVMLLAAVFFKEKITKKKVLACIIAFLGCLFVSGLLTSTEAIPTIALFTGILSALGYGLYSIFGEIAIRKGYKPLTITTYTFLFALLGCLFFVSPSEIAEAAGKTQTWMFILMAVGAAACVSLLPYMLYTNGLMRTTPGKAAITASIEPISATVLGFLFFGEVPNFYSILGIICVILAIVILNTKGFKKHVKKGSED